MDIMWYIAIIGAIKSSLANFLSDLEELDIDAQLREFDEMMDKIDTDNAIGDKLDDLSKLFSDDCLYKCKNGAKPVHRKGHVPTTNGCGSFGLTLDTKALPEMTKCCEKHDYCYDTCNSDRGKCDDAFKQCLSGMCNRLKSSLTKKQYEVCKETADLIYSGTSALGCSPYLSAQETACDCSIKGGENSSKDRFKGEAEKNKKTPSDTDIKDNRNSKHEMRDRTTEAKFSETHKRDKKKMQNQNDEL